MELNDLDPFNNNQNLAFIFLIFEYHLVEDVLGVP